jgi:hypothetical protein
MKMRTSIPDFTGMEVNLLDFLPLAFQILLPKIYQDNPEMTRKIPMTWLIRVIVCTSRFESAVDAGLNHGEKPRTQKHGKCQPDEQALKMCAHSAGIISSCMPPKPIPFGSLTAIEKTARLVISQVLQP